MNFLNGRLTKNRSCQPLRNSLVEKNNTNPNIAFKSNFLNTNNTAKASNQAAQNFNKITNDKVANKLNYVI